MDQCNFCENSSTSRCLVLSPKYFGVIFPSFLKCCVYCLLFAEAFGVRGNWSYKCLPCPWTCRDLRFWCHYVPWFVEILGSWRYLRICIRSSLNQLNQLFFGQKMPTTKFWKRTWTSWACFRSWRCTACPNHIYRSAFENFKWWSSCGYRKLANVDAKGFCCLSMSSNCELKSWCRAKHSNIIFSTLSKNPGSFVSPDLHRTRPVTEASALISEGYLKALVPDVSLLPIYWQHVLKEFPSHPVKTRDCSLNKSIGCTLYWTSILQII